MWRGDLRPGEGVSLDGGRIVVRVEAKSGQASRIAIEAPKDVSIRRLENAVPSDVARNGITRPK